LLHEQLKELLTQVVRQGASDLHISAGEHPILRLEGRLVKLKDHTVLEPERIERMIVGLLSGEQNERLIEDKQIDLSYAITGVARFRGNIFYEQKSLGAVFRVIPNEPKTIEQLGVPPMIKDLARKTQGLILCTGPSGSGKTTTLAAVLDYINSTRNCHIITIEDPVEYIFSNKMSLIRQREIGVHTNSFAEALRAALRQDPDVILVGEMRDLDTISTAITAAETGHLVLSTLHTNGAVDTVNRIIDVFPAHQQAQVRMQLASTLEGVFSQLLVPKVKGKGLVLASEIMISTGAVKNLIREQRSHHLRNVIETSSELGMQTMEAALKNLYSRGLISYEDAICRAFDVESFRKLVQAEA
jgi:twitching motility protein PilT